MPQNVQVFFFMRRDSCICKYTVHAWHEGRGGGGGAGFPGFQAAQGSLIWREILPDLTDVYTKNPTGMRLTEGEASFRIWFQIRIKLKISKPVQIKVFLELSSKVANYPRYHRFIQYIVLYSTANAMNQPQPPQPTPLIREVSPNFCGWASTLLNQPPRPRVSLRRSFRSLHDSQMSLNYPMMSSSRSLYNFGNNLSVSKMSLQDFEPTLHRSRGEP
jgi:hypothetical protein